MINQRTIAKAVNFTGIGLHSGKKINLTLKPAEVDFGIQFQRVDILNAPLIKPTADSVSATENNTTIGTPPYNIHTVEHLLSVFYGLGINNILCEIDGPEVPIMDGSGSSFVYILRETGIVAQNRPKNLMIILKPLRIEIGEKWVEIEPNTNLVIDSTIVFSHPLIKSQKRVFEFSSEGFIKEISRSRTFGLLRDVDNLKKKGLIKGGSLDNAIVLDDFKVINSDGLRFQDEFVRHKILDTLGDIALLGFELCGKITTYKSGHKLHNLLCRELIRNPSYYEIVPATSLDKERLKVFNLSPLIGQSVF